MKEGFGKLISLTEALRTLDGVVRRFEGAEALPLMEAAGRITAEAVKSGVDVPHFRRAAMDGYAVRAEETFGASYERPIALRVTGVIEPGDVPTSAIDSGRCVRISTGGAMPPNADAVVMVEYTDRTDDDTIVVQSAVAPGANVVEVGSDLKVGDTVVDAGVLLGPRRLGALAAAGVASVKVVARPRVAVLSTGAELLAADEPLAPGKVFNINSVTLSAALARFCCEPVDCGVVPDRLDAMREAVLRAAADSELVLISGGSSLGTGDLVPRVLAALGRLLFHGIAVKPGKPTSAGVVADTLVLGLPGYPTSALSNFYMLVLPILERMLGTRWPRPSVRVALGRKTVSTIGRHEFMAVRLDGGEAFPLRRGSSAITTLALADGFVEIDAETEVLPAGVEVTVRLFP